MEIDITTLDSTEELHFAWYLEELLKYGYIVGYEAHAITFNLSDMIKIKAVDRLLKTKINYKDMGLLRENTYTPDFSIFWAKKAEGIFYEVAKNSEVIIDKTTPFIIPEDQNSRLNLEHNYYLFDNEDIETSIVDVKPAVATRFAKNISSIYTFPIEQKWVYEKFGIYVQKVIAEEKRSCLFAQTFTPERYLTNDKLSTRRTIHHITPTIESYVQEKLEQYDKIKRRLSGQSVLFDGGNS